MQPMRLRWCRSVEDVRASRKLFCDPLADHTRRQSKRRAKCKRRVYPRHFSSADVTSFPYHNHDSSMDIISRAKWSYMLDSKHLNVAGIWVAKKYGDGLWEKRRLYWIEVRVKDVASPRLKPSAPTFLWSVSPPDLDARWQHPSDRKSYVY